MNKIIGAIIVVVLLVAGYMLFVGARNGETTSTTSDSEVMENDTNEDNGGISLDVSIDTDAKVFDVRGVNFAFSESVIRVKQGDTVTINFQSDEGYHDWVIDEFGAATDKVRPGTVTSVTFVADKVGTFEYYCSVGEHRAQGMIGNLIVE